MELTLAREDWMIRGPDCYNRLVNELPDVRFSLVSGPNTDVMTDLVFVPEDFIMQTADSELCILVLCPIDNRNRTDLHLTNRLLRHLGGIHLDYQERRVGFFDPV